MPDLNYIIESTEKALADLGPRKDNIETKYDIVLVHTSDFYPPESKIDDALYSAWSLFNRLKEIKAELSIKTNDQD